MECRLQARVDSRLLARQQVHRLLRYRIETGLLHPDTRPRATLITTCSVYATAGYVDKRHDALFLVVGGCCTSGCRIGADAQVQGKRHELPYPMCFSVGQVNANAYPLTARFYADGSGTAFHTQTVTSSKAFRLPRGTRYTTVESRSSRQTRLSLIYLATTAQELKGVT